LLLIMQQISVHLGVFRLLFKPYGSRP
jgi:hypothetical protein